MIDPNDLLESADVLVKESGSRKPKQTFLRRAVSSAYYALFHAVAADAANSLCGVERGKHSSAWKHVYRSLDHGTAKSACEKARNMGFPLTLRNCANAFIALQEERHKADYDPGHRISRTDARKFIQEARNAINDLHASDVNDRRAFAIQLLLKKRG